MVRSSRLYQIENVEADAEIIVEMDNEDLSVYEAEDRH